MASDQVQGPQKSTTTPLPPKCMKIATPQAHSHDYITTQEATPVTDLLIRYDSKVFNLYF